MTPSVTGFLTSLLAATIGLLLALAILQRILKIKLLDGVTLFLLATLFLLPVWCMFAGFFAHMVVEFFMMGWGIG